MTDILSDPPHVPLLQWLVQGSLKQNLVQATRLWVWLRLLYGPDSVRLSLPDPFSYSDWRDRFFLDDHPSGETAPGRHSLECPCAKSMDAWLFAPLITMGQPEWEEYRTTHKPAIATAINHFKQQLAQHDVLPKNIDILLSKTRLFGVTRRSLSGDLQTLARIHWLKRSGSPKHSTYRRVSQWPDRPISAQFGQSEIIASRVGMRDLAFFTQPDLAAIAHNLSDNLSDNLSHDQSNTRSDLLADRLSRNVPDALFQNVSTSRRFFVHVDYVVAQTWIDRVDDWHHALREIWQQEPVPPIQLKFLPAGAPNPFDLVVYPVCVYYYRRGPYLCGYGEVPIQTQNTQRSQRPPAESLAHFNPQPQPQWLNYRLDRIQALDPLDWDHAHIPVALHEAFEQDRLPTPDVIQIRMAEAWGFDHYQPIQCLVLRFDQDWNRRYIHNSIRHDTFKPIEYEAIAPLIRQSLTGVEQKKALKLLQSRSPEDAYYQALYRQDDPNVHQRLRAWRPHVEVLLPWALRQRMTDEMRREMEFYA